MTKLAANLTMMFNEVEFLDRFAAAAGAGFKGVEYLFPYPYPKEQLAQKLAAHNLAQVLHNFPAGDWAKGERGIACQPERVGEFQDSVGKAIEYATALGCTQLNCLAGIPPAGADRDKVRATLVSNLRFAADQLGAVGIKVLTEPINTFDIPGFFLSGTRQALEILKDVGSANLYLLYDIYHMQRMEGELANTIKAHLPRIAHFQLADNPGRNEPGTGEINYRFLFGFLDSIGYDGWIGCEYRPKGNTVDGLSWRAAHGV
jgi:hydroxypyruvate isomerase